MNFEEAQTLDLPVFEQPAEWNPTERIEFTAVMREFEPMVRFYLLNYDSPEKRVKAKNPEEFVL
jgi:hypothetical protein